MCRKVFAGPRAPVDQMVVIPSFRCNLACKYCHRPGDHATLSPADARKAVDLLLAKGSTPKRLMFMGGEPLLCFDQVGEVCDYARARAARAGLKIGFSIITNGTVINRRIIDFLVKNDFKVYLSINGRPSRHDANRLDHQGHGSFRLVRKNWERLLEIPQGNLIVNYAIEPRTASHILDDLRFLEDSGFRFIDLCPIYGMRWSAPDLQRLQKNYLAAVRYVLGRMTRRRYLILNNIGRYFKLFTGRAKFYECRDDQVRSCPLGFRLHLFPGGGLMLYHFAFQENLSRYSLGNIKSGLRREFQNCTFAPDSTRCRRCLDKFVRMDIDYRKAYLLHCGVPASFHDNHVAANSLLCDGPIGRRIAEFIWRSAQAGPAGNCYEEYLGIGDEWCALMPY